MAYGPRAIEPETKSISFTIKVLFFVFSINDVIQHRMKKYSIVIYVVFFFRAGVNHCRMTRIQYWMFQQVAHPNHPSYWYPNCFFWMSTAYPLRMLSSVLFRRLSQVNTHTFVSRFFSWKQRYRSSFITNGIGHLVISRRSLCIWASIGYRIPPKQSSVIDTGKSTSRIYSAQIACPVSVFQFN